MRMSSPDENSQLRQENFERAQRAVWLDQINTLKDVLNDLPEFNTLVTEEGRSLLNLAIYHDRKEIFDHFMSLNCFDLEVTDRYGHSVLDMILLKYFTGNERCFDDYYATSLIKAGANVDRIVCCGNTLLHLAVLNKLYETAELLIQKGADLNALNAGEETPLHNIFTWCKEDASESVGLLLYYGGDPTICDYDGHLPFDCAVLEGLELSMLEHLFYYTFDSLSEFKISSSVLNRLIEKESPLLDQVLEISSEVVYVEYDFEPINLCRMKANSLKVMIEKFNSFVRLCFAKSLVGSSSNIFSNIENWEILLSSELRLETVDFIGKLMLWEIIGRSLVAKIDQEKIIQLIYYLLTYGLNVTGVDLHYVYETLGYCDLFRTMLHLDYIAEFEYRNVVIPKIIYDINFDLRTTDFDSVSSRQLESILDHYLDSKLRISCESRDDANLVNKVKQLPTVPSLLQLARDETRRHLVKRWNLKKASQYYSLVKKLPISTAYQKILTFETKLYA